MPLLTSIISFYKSLLIFKVEAGGKYTVLYGGGALQAFIYPSPFLT